MQEGFANVQESFAIVQEGFAIVQESFANVQESFANVQESFANMQESFANGQEGFAIVQESFAIVQEGFAIVQESFAIVQESFAIVQESFAIVQESFAIVQEGFAIVRESFAVSYCIQKTVGPRRNLDFFPDFSTVPHRDAAFSSSMGLRKLLALGYRHAVRPVFFSLEAERAHHLAIGALARISRHPAVLGVLRTIFAETKPVEAFGLHFPNPIGLAAGFDKNAVALPAWAALGFGFAEIGTVTAFAQPGNPAPRIFRYPAQAALINRLGFNNEGAAAVAARLAGLRNSGLWPRFPVGINLGKSKIAPLENALEDYLASFQRLAAYADYIALNVSSPNTPGLRQLQGREALDVLLGGMQAANRQREKPLPLLLKMAPDLEFGQIEEIITLAEAHGLAGLIATNTTLEHGAIAGSRDETGGLSGAPLEARATKIVRFLCERTALPVIGVGGIFSPDDARRKLDAGARLVQLYTGYIYGGPTIVPELVAALRGQSPSAER